MREFRWILHNLAAWRLGQLLLVAWALHQQLGCLEAVGWSYAGTSWYSYLMLFTPFHSIEKTKCSLCRLNEFNGRFSSGILDILIFGGVRAYKVSWKDTVILVQWSSSNFNLPKSSTPSRFYGFFRYVIYEWLPWRVLKPPIGPCESVANRISCCFAAKMIRQHICLLQRRQVLAWEGQESGTCSPLCGFVLCCVATG